MGSHIIGIGELLWDIFPAGKEVGGAPANFTYHINALGGDGLLVSSIGSDRPGDEMLERLDSLPVNHRCVSCDTEHPTGTVTVEVGAGGEPSFTIHKNVAWDFIPQTRQLMELGKNAAAILFGTLAQRSAVSRTTIRNFVEQASASTLRIFDLNLRQSFYSNEIIEWSLEACEILKLNENELQVLAQILSIEGEEIKLLDEISRRYDLKLIAYTRGAKGSILHTQDEVSVHNGYKTEVVDTVGSGDAFTAALVTGIMSGINLETVNDYANRLASFVCSRQGATPLLPADLKSPDWLNGR